MFILFETEVRRTLGLLNHQMKFHFLLNCFKIFFLRFLSRLVDKKLCHGNFLSKQKLLKCNKTDFQRKNFSFRINSRLTRQQTASSKCPKVFLLGEIRNSLKNPNLQKKRKKSPTEICNDSA